MDQTGACRESAESRVEMSRVAPAKKRRGEVMKRVLSLAYGLVAYGIFLPTLVYAIFFVGNIVVPKTIDSGQESPLLLAAAINTVLLGLFAVQHSVMARKGFKQAWTRIVPKHLERPTYVLAASLVLILLLWQWRSIPQAVWELHGPAATLQTFTFWLGWTLVLTSTFLINHFELFGVQQVWGYFRGRQYGNARFRTPVLYRIVRHPLYLGFVIAFWSAARMSLGHLIFSIATTGYILLGIYLEERDLVAEHGEAYRNYREQVPMLVPLLKASKDKSELAVATSRMDQR
jgi:protein-S-isoprenylcysteine O-methyltransferase Ste14